MVMSKIKKLTGRPTVLSSPASASALSGRAPRRKEDAFAVPLLKLRTLACKKNATPKLDPPRQVRCHPICYQRPRSRKEQHEYE